MWSLKVFKHYNSQPVRKTPPTHTHTHLIMNKERANNEIKGLNCIAASPISVTFNITFPLLISRHTGIGYQLEFRWTCNFLTLVIHCRRIFEINDSPMRVELYPINTEIANMLTLPHHMWIICYIHIISMTNKALFIKCLGKIFWKAK